MEAGCREGPGEEHNRARIWRTAGLLAVGNGGIWRWSSRLSTSGYLRGGAWMECGCYGTLGTGVFLFFFKKNEEKKGRNCAVQTKIVQINK